MKRIMIFLFMFLLFTTIAAAQANITFEWDASADDDRDPANPNPVNYNFYICSDAGMTDCEPPVDVGQSLTYTHTFGGGIYWIYVTAWRYIVAVTEDPAGLSDPYSNSDESPKSNHIGFRVQVPPGNPANTKVRTITIGRNAAPGVKLDDAMAVFKRTSIESFKRE